MKHLQKITQIIITLLILISCNSNSDDSSGGSDFITAKIDGVDFSSSFNELILTNSFEPPYKLLEIRGTSNNEAQDFILITVASYLEPGVYNLPDENHPLLGFQFAQLNFEDIWTASANFNSTTGKVTITQESDTQIKGTFSFNALNTTNNSIKHITEGKFNLNK